MDTNKRPPTEVGQIPLKLKKKRRPRVRKVIRKFRISIQKRILRNTPKTPLLYASDAESLISNRGKHDASVGARPESLLNQTVQPPGLSGTNNSDDEDNKKLNSGATTVSTPPKAGSNSPIRILKRAAPKPTQPPEEIPFKKESPISTKKEGPFGSLRKLRRRPTMEATPTSPPTSPPKPINLNHANPYFDVGATTTDPSLPIPGMVAWNPEQEDDDVSQITKDNYWSRVEKEQRKQERRQRRKSRQVKVQTLSYSQNNSTATKEEASSSVDTMILVAFIVMVLAIFWFHDAWIRKMMVQLLVTRRVRS